MARRPRLVFFGNERLVSGMNCSTTPVLRGLIDSGYDIAAVVSHHSDTKSRNARPLEVAAVARDYNIPIYTPNKPSEITDILRSLDADAAILVAYGRIIPQSLIDIFPRGIINLHPSTLPRYRGPTPIESAILNGDVETGVSIMQLSAGMDSGPVYSQTVVKLNGTESKFALGEQLAQIGASMILEILPSILDGSLVPVPQDENAATYCQLFDKSDSLLDPSKLTALEAERKVRAHLGYPKTRHYIDGRPVIITAAHISDVNKTILDVVCSDKNVLSIDQLISHNGKLMDAASYLNGYQK